MERLYDLDDPRKEYVLPFNSCFGSCRVVLLEIITPFRYTKIKRCVIIICLSTWGPGEPGAAPVDEVHSGLQY
jgi:hypothetical protein